nr:LysE family transporter [Nitrincola sp. A-D6]
MFGIIDLPLFILAGLLLNLVPGPDTLVVISRTAMYGWHAGSATAFGVAAGTLVHISAATLGLSAFGNLSSGFHPNQIYWCCLPDLSRNKSVIQTR